MVLSEQPYDIPDQQEDDDMKLWGGRFEKETNAMVDAFNACIGFGSRLYEQDILGSIAHATMLGEENIIPPEDAKKIVEGLKGILADAREGKIQWSTEAEDIHMNVETILIQRIGEAGKRLHTGRSRNDQCVLDTRMLPGSPAWRRVPCWTS